MTNDMPELRSPRAAAMRRIPFAVGAVLIGAAIGYAGVFGIGGVKRNATGDPACRGAVDLAQKLAPLAHGEVAALTMATAPLRLPDLTFEDANGKPKKLSDWRGRTVLVNLWGTWCVPCRKEMPRLGYFSDPKAKVFQDLKAIGRALGMPTSVLVDGEGCEIATIAGPAEWDSDDAVKLITAAVKPMAAGL